TVALNQGGYQSLVMVYDPAHQKASVYLDGRDTPLFTDYAGFAKATALGEETFVRFGAVTSGSRGEGHYRNVSLNVPEPGSTALLMLCGGIAAAIRPARR